MPTLCLQGQNPCLGAEELGVLAPTQRRCRSNRRKHACTLESLMRHFGLGEAAAPRKPVPRGIARSGPAVLSYGFRPFFLLAALFAFVAMVVWIGALSLGWEAGGSYGILNWHAHEMLFGYTAAALAGYMLTAIPNWTGRLPVSG